MIDSIEIQNFKCFDNLKLSFGSLTLITGFNGGGKSTAVQPLLLLSQGFRSSTTQRVFELNGELVRLGTVGDILPAETKDPDVKFGVLGTHGAQFWTFNPRAGDRYLSAKTAAGSEKSSETAVARSLADLAYLSAIREGTAEAYPIPDSASERLGDVGSDGRFAAYLYDRSVDNEVSSAKMYPGESATSMRKQLDAWFGALFAGAQVNVQSIPLVSLLSLQFRLSEIGEWRRPANVGYGLTYAFPILVSLLTARPGQIVVIDSPEAHLHPLAQSQMGRILAHFAGSGVQILVETHSDHLLNGARLAVKEAVIAPDILRIHFFTGPSPSGHGVVSPTIDSEGRINEWPDGFFDQSEKDLSRLSGWS
ncbi:MULTISPECIES: DUF3696 domain-containing protein [unclassified Mesorhizobium]|uniref:AAA family ATPase n=1 Tax=unclassified Mesorhizobium TaxID=325217 RepID=UPI003338FFB4